jgi:chitodextrinase
MLVTIPAGTHAGTYTVTIQATNQGRVATQTLELKVTNDLPTAAAPIATTRVGSTVSLNADGTPNKLPMRISWPAATDPSSAIAGYELQLRRDGGTWSAPIGTTAGDRTVDFSGLSLASRYEFRVRARDAIGNWSAWAAGAPVVFRAVSDRSLAVHYGGTWSRTDVSTGTNRVWTSSTRNGATATYTFTGRGIAVVMPRGTSRGKVSIVLDGKTVATVDTHASSSQPRRVVFRRDWLTSATHTIVVKVQGTSGRPTVSVDGFVALL